MQRMKRKIMKMKNNRTSKMKIRIHKMETKIFKKVIYITRNKILKILMKIIRN